MRKELLDELRDMYYSDEANDDLRDWCFDNLCDDNRFLERDLRRAMETNERWETWSFPITVAIVLMIGVATWAIAIG